jgi:methionine-rich copper-binding protein CopC
MKIYRPLFLLACFGLLLLTLHSVLAHAALVRSDPSADAIVDSSPPEIFVWFSQALSTGSHLQIIDSQFREVDKGSTFIDASDATLMRIQLNGLPPGRYTVNWKAESVDGHESSGAYDFFVRESTGISSEVLIGGVVLLILGVGLVFMVLLGRRR